MEGAAANPQSGCFKFLECGNGDTILIRAGEEWALVDCNLLPQTIARLEKCLREHDIRRLRFVVVTHFDRDHVRGMATFLQKHFVSAVETSGRTTGFWQIDQLILPVPIGELETNLRAMGSCYLMLEKFARDSAQSQYCQDAQAILELALELNTQKPVAPGIPRVRDYQPGTTLDGATRFGPFEVVFLAPAVKSATKFVRWFRKAFGAADRVRLLEEMKKITADYDERERGAKKHFDWLEGRLKDRVMADRFWDTNRPGWNANSIVMAFRDPKGDRTVLLCGDLPKREWRWAAMEWQKFCRTGAADPEQVPDCPFDLVKASHHGSAKDHVSELYERFGRRSDSKNGSHVIVSALAGDSKHPAENVMRDWNRCGWQVWHTGKGQMPRNGMPGGTLIRPAGITVNIATDGEVPARLLPEELML